MKKTLRFEKERWVFPFGEGFEMPFDQIPQSETALHASTRKFRAGVCRSNGKY
jgi:hypothetical protein